MDNPEKAIKSYRSVIKTEDTPLAYFFAAQWANRFLPWAVEKNLSPNQVTTVSLILSVIVGLCFIHNSIWIVTMGSFILIFSFVLDCLDGQLARYTGKITPFGFWLDRFGDRVRELVYWICLCVGHSQRTAEIEIWKWGMLAAIAFCVRFSSGMYRDRALQLSPPPPLTMESRKKVSIRIWIQRFFYFNIAERLFFLAFAAPLGFGIQFFQIAAIASFVMMVVLNIQAWGINREHMFNNISI